MIQKEGYSPLPKAVQDRISTAWSEYRESIGLEGEAYLKLVQSGHSHNQAVIELELNRKDREEKIEIWESIWLK